MAGLALFHRENQLREEVWGVKKIPPVPPPPVLKMTVNFHPQLQNGCLMINRGSELRPSSHAGSTHTQLRVTAKRATPPPPPGVVKERCAQKEGCFLSDGSSAVSPGGVR